MAGPNVPVALPDGTTGTLPAAEVPQLKGQGGRVLTPEEHAAAQADIAKSTGPVDLGGIAKDYGETWLAGAHAAERGVGEAIGLPLDHGIAGIAELYGGPSARKSTTSYLRQLDEKHPIASGWMGMAGNIQGALGAAELTGSPTAISANAERTAAGVAARMGASGVENVVQATTRDLNEAALGDKVANGEKLVADMPKHFIVGALLAGGFEAGAAGLEHGVAALARRGVPVLEDAASGAVGREVGLAGDEAVEAGGRIRGLNQGEIPRSKGELADVLTAEQGKLRGQGAEAHAGLLDALEGSQKTEAAALDAQHEGARKAAALAGEQGIQKAEAAGAETALEGAARGGAHVEEAELQGAARRQAAHIEAFDAQDAGIAAGERAAGGEALHAEMASAGRPVDQVAEHYGALRTTLSDEQMAAQRAVEEIAGERAANARELAEALERLKKGGAAPAGKITPAEFDEMIDTYLGITGHRGDPSTRWAAEELLLKEYGKDIADVAETSGIAGREVERLQALAGHLQEAHESAIKHAQQVAGVARSAESQAQKDIALAGRAADTRVTSFQKTTSREAVEAGRLATKAADRVRVVEAETAKAVEAARAIGQKEADKASRAAQKLVAEARDEAAAARANVEKVAAKEKAALAKTHEQQIKKVPKLSEKTDVDPLIKGMRGVQEENARRPAVSVSGGVGALFSVMHGNPLGALMSLGSSFAAGQARNQSNLLAARALRGLSTRLSAVDEAVRKGAASILGRTGASGAMSAERIHGREKGQPKFEDIANRLYAAQTNPMLIESGVRAALGDVAQQAPETYGQVLQTTQRAQAFLLSILPPAQKDPNSLTPHLEEGTVSETDKYDFMRAVRTVDDPLSIFQDVRNGSVTEQQVAAIEHVYPMLYDEMRQEVRYQTVYLTKPVDYDREIHVGTLLGVITNEVLEPEFQKTLYAAYKEKSAQGAPASGGGSKPSNTGSAKSMMSASESVEGGGTP